MKTRKSFPFILMADDDPDDYILTKAALKECGSWTDIDWVADGQELLDYLSRRGKFVDADPSPPTLILLDLNMPVKNGKETLSALKADPKLKQIPVIIYTNSKEKDDILDGYQLGANTYISKPTDFQSLVETMGALAKYWLGTALLPLPDPNQATIREERDTVFGRDHQ